LKDFALLETHVRREQVGKAEQRLRVGRGQFCGKTTQIGMLGQRTRDESVFTALRQKD